MEIVFFGIVLFDNFINFLNLKKMVNNITDKSFKQEVIEAQGVILVDFWAPWCGPCMMMGPIIDDLAEEFRGKIKFGKINVDENPDTASAYEIMSIPSIKIFKNGKILAEFAGVQSKEVLREELIKLI